MHKQILKLAIPNILSNLTVPLLGMVDLHLMGYLDSDLYMGAIALGGVIFNFLYWGFAFLRMSISGISAQANGRKDSTEMAMILFRGLFIALGGGILLLIFQHYLGGFSFWLLKGSPEVKTLAANYFYIRIWAAPAAIALMVINGWFIGMQNSIYPLIISIVINVVNIAVSFTLVKVVGLEERGVAMGSLIAQYAGIILAVLLFFKKYKYILKYFKVKQIFLLKQLKQFLNVSKDIFIRTLCIIAVFTFFTSQSAGFGNIQLAANSALLQFLFLFSYFLDGFAYAAEAIIGHYFGAKNKIKFNEAVKKLFIWGASFALVFTLLYLVLGKELLHLFTNQKAVLQEASKYIIWLIFLPIASFASFIWDGIYIGCIASKAMRNTMLIATICFFFIPFYILQPLIGAHAIWISMLLFMASRGLSQTILAPKVVYSHL